MEPPEHDLYLARLVRANLTAANYGSYPETSADWHEVARRLGVSVRHDPQLSFSACLLDGLLIHGDGTPIELARWFAHELAENRLRCECEPPFVLLDPEGAYHRISRMVETLKEPGG